MIYDLGSHCGQDLPYYLRKADRVVAVEANPELCQRIRRDFAREIADGRLIVENCVLTVDFSAGPVPFYIHRSDDVLSQFPRPRHGLEEFDMVHLPSKEVRSIIRTYGPPHYIKVDLEGFDGAVLRALFDAGIRPPYISAESHSAEVFATLLAVGGYRAFQLVDGESVVRKYRDAVIQTEAGNVPYSFPFHSAGPFGVDLGGTWMTPDNFFRVLSVVGLGWKDIHATNVHHADESYAPQPTFIVNVGIDY